MKNYRDNPFNEAGYKKLIEKIFDIEEWYHEYHFMIDYILEHATNEHIVKYLGIKKVTLLEAWSIDLVKPTYQKYLKVAKCYEELEDDK